MAANETDPAQTATSKSAKKHKKKKSKAASAQSPAENVPKPYDPDDDVNGEKEGEGTPEESVSTDKTEPLTAVASLTGREDTEPKRRQSVSTQRKSSIRSNGVDKSKWAPGSTSSQSSHPDGKQDDSLDPTIRLETAVRERNQLREEVTELRQSLEQVQQQHGDETAELRRSLEDSRAGRDLAETKYQKLLAQVNTIKTQLGERLKADAAELERAREQIETLEGNISGLTEGNESLQGQVSQLSAEKDEQTQEVAELRSRTHVSQQNWAKERDDLLSREAHAQQEFEEAKQAMQDWQILATEERSMREGLSDKVTELEEQLSSQRDAWERASSERESQSSTVDGLQRALQEVHEARKQERRELVQSSESHIGELKRLLKTAESSSSEAQSALDAARQELEKLQPFEKEVKEKNLLIGKLRHEAVILNDHLTKALRFLKKGKPEDNVDRQLVTNHFLQFLSLDRSDPKKFQVLQLISALLGWTEEQKESAGLTRPGASTQTNLKVPLSSPFRRASSTAALSPLNSVFSPTSMGGSSVPATPDLGFSSAASKEGLAELWSDFLEREAQEGHGSGRHSRRSSGMNFTGTPTGKSIALSPAGSVSSPGLKIPKQRLEELDEGGDSGASTPRG